MTPNDLVARIRAGDADSAITEFLAATPGLTLEILAVNAVNWQLVDVSDAILRRLIDVEPENLGAHLTLANSLFSQKKYDEALPHFQFTLRRKPDDPWYQSGVCWGHSHARQPGELRQHLLDAKRAIPEDRHISWQHARAIFMMPEDLVSALEEWIDTQRQQKVAARRARTGEASVETRTSSKESQEPSDGPQTVLGAPHAGSFPEFAKAETGDASEIGSVGMAMSGSVAAGGAAGQFRFEYGTSPERLDHATPWTSLPGKRNARQIISDAWTPGRRWYYCGDASWEGQSAPQVRAHWPFGQDPNHVSGIGFIELLFACWHNSVQFDGYQAIRGWEGSDLRDAEVQVSIHPHNLNTEDYLHCLGVGNVETYWMLTGQAIDLSDLPPGGGMLTFNLPSDPSQWTFAGTNQEEQEDHGRYRYGPLDDALARNLGNLVLVAPFGSPNKTTQGAVSLGEVSITYRDNNILHPDNHARLTEWPAQSPCDPMMLTNGLYGGTEDGWYQLTSPDTPPRFTWELPSPQKVTTVVIHQDPILPTTKCRLTLSDHTGAADSWELDLPVSTPPFNSPAHRTIQLEGSGTYSTVTLELLSGRYDDGLGLQALEVFAKDFVPPPSTDLVSVSADATGFEPGSTVYYRVVTRTDTAHVSGDIFHLRLPDTDSPPILHSITTYSNRAQRTILQVRANAMGRKAELHWRLDDKEWQKCPLGWENTPVHRYIVLDKTASGDHQVTVRLSSEAGDSEETFYNFHAA